MKADYYKSQLKEQDKLADYTDKLNNQTNLNAYNQQMSLDEGLADDKRTAYFNNEKIMKYLPNQLKINGLGNNVGANSQAYLDANNNYMNQLAQINKDYNKNSNDLYSAYQTELNDNADRGLQHYNDIKALESYGMQDIANRAETFEKDGRYYSQADVDSLYSMIDSDPSMPSEVKESLRAYIGNNFNSKENRTEAQKAQDEKEETRQILKNSFNVSDDDEGLDNATVGASVLGAGHNDSNKKGSKQYRYVESIIDKAKNGQIANGTVVNVNYGAGSADNYVYYNGRWYHTNRSADLTWNNWEETIQAYQKLQSQMNSRKYRLGL